MRWVDKNINGYLVHAPTRRLSKEELWALYWQIDRVLDVGEVKISEKIDRSFPHKNELGTLFADWLNKYPNHHIIRGEFYDIVADAFEYVYAIRKFKSAVRGAAGKQHITAPGQNDKGAE